MKQMKIKYRFPISTAAVVFVFLTAFIISSCSTTANSADADPSGKSIKIGVLVPKSGYLAEYYEQLDAGISAYRDRYLKGQNVGGIDIDLVYYDTKSDIQTGVKGCQYLINRAGVDLILGPMTTNASREVIPICGTAGIPVVPLWATATNLAAQSPAAFRIVFTNFHTGYLLGKFSAENLNGTRAAVISADNLHMKESYAGFSETFLELSNGSGRIIDIVYDGDAANIANQVVDFDADIVFLNFRDAIANWTENLDVIKAIESREQDVIYLGDMTWSTIERSKFFKGISPEIYYINHYSADSYEPSSKDFALYYETRYRKKPDALAALGYETLALVCSFFNDHPGIHKDEVIGALLDYEFTGLLGKIRFNDYGDAFKSAAILRHSVKGNEYITTIKPEVFRLEEFQKKQEEIPDVPQEERKRVAVLTLASINTDETQAKIVTELIGSAVTRTKQYVVIEESRRDKIISEWKTSLSGLADEDAPFEIGGLLQARNVITGSLAQGGSKIVLNLRLLDIETGVTLYSAFRIYGSYDFLLEDCENLTYELIDQDAEPMYEGPG